MSGEGVGTPKLNPEGSEGLRRTVLIGFYAVNEGTLVGFKGVLTKDEVTGRVIGRLMDPFGQSIILGEIQSGTFSFKRVQTGARSEYIASYVLALNEDGGWNGQYSFLVENNQGEIFQRGGIVFCKEFPHHESGSSSVTREAFQRTYEMTQDLIEKEGE